MKRVWLLAILGTALTVHAQPLPQPPHLEGAEKKALLDRYAKQLDTELGLLTALDELDRDSTENDNKTHRALDDVHCHVAEARAFAAFWKSK